MAWETLKLYWRVTWRYKWLLVGSETGATVFVLANDILSPLVISQIINKLSQNPTGLEFSDFGNLIFWFVALHAIAIVANRIVMQTYIRLEPNVIRDLENLSFKKLQEHSLAFFADNFSGALVAKVNRLTSSYQRVIDTVLGELGNLGRRYIAALIIMFFLNKTIAIVFLVWTIIFCFSLIYLHRRKLRYSQAAATAQTNVTARLADIIANTLTIRSFSRTGEETKRFSDLTQERRDSRFKSYLIGEYIRIYKAVTILILDIIVIILSVQAAINGYLAVGSVVLIQFYLFLLIGELWNLGRFMDRIEESLADASEMTEIILKPHDVVDPPDPEKVSISEGKIQFRNVTFQYSDAKQSEALFTNFNLTIPAGQKVGLVGHSGGGKTTLTKLLLRFMDINSGEILIDGQNIAKITQENLREHIAYVPQEPLLFHRSILENISYGKPSASQDQIETVAKSAHAAEFIDELSNKYDTVVGERGVKLSGGQRQRVAIARAMLKEAPVLILDEATSSLDSISEKLITSALDQLMEKRTTIVVAHRLSTIRKMDRILVIEDGAIKEDGTHEQLLEKGGTYATLWAHQSGDFIGDE